MTRESFPEIPREALKSHGQPERVERVWRRLELDLEGAPRTRSAGFWLLPVTAVGIFALGVVVGARSFSSPAEVAAVAEPRAVPPLPGAGPAAEPIASAELQRAVPVRKPTPARRAAPAEPSAVETFAGGYEQTPAFDTGETTAAAEFAEWEKLAEAGDFRAAKAALDRDGGFERAAARASASQLLVLADVARGSGSREQAAQALRRVLSMYVSAPEAPLAAWTLGNLLARP